MESSVKCSIYDVENKTKKNEEVWTCTPKQETRGEKVTKDYFECKKSGGLRGFFGSIPFVSELVDVDIESATAKSVCGDLAKRMAKDKGEILKGVVSEPTITSSIEEMMNDLQKGLEDIFS